MPRNSQNPSSKPYHHGDLRRALLDASLEVLEQSGPEALTLREVARRAGVSHTAPYRHFADKDELLAAVAEEGFSSLRQRMAEAAGAAPNSIEALERSGLAYVKLALDHPAHCAVMFGRVAMDLRLKQQKSDSPQLEASVNAGDAAFEGLVQLVAACQRDGYARDDDTYELANIAWSQVHGIATLAIAQMLKRDDGEPLDGEQTMAFVERAVKNVTRGFAPVSED